MNEGRRTTGSAAPAIGFLGDVMLGRSVGAEIEAGCPPAEVWDADLRALAAGLDLVVCNLECCISERGHPTSLIPGKPFFFRGPPEAAGSLAALGARAVTLANNHALDYGPDALADTLALLHEQGIAAAGAGAGTADARRPIVVEAAGARIGVVAATDHPAQYASTDTGWGVAHADLRRGAPDWLLDAVAALADSCDLAVVELHWGPNMTVEPARWQRRAAAAIRRAGADIVVGHSAHLFHGVAWSAGAPLVFDLGDALDDYRVDPVLRNDLGVLAIWRPSTSREQLEMVGLRLDYARTSLARGADADWIAARLERACAPFGTHVERVGEQTFRLAP